MSSSITIALWGISDSFNIDVAIVNWVANAFLVSLAASILPVGRIADWIGRGRVFVYGLAIFSLSSFLSAITPSFPLLILFRVLQGIDGVCIFATSIAIAITKNTQNMINAINTTLWIYLFIALFATISTTIIRNKR